MGSGSSGSSRSVVPEVNGVRVGQAFSWSRADWRASEYAALVKLAPDIPSI
jgi:hypothetical protein